jgi:hypothetical protein
VVTISAIKIEFNYKSSNHSKLLSRLIWMSNKNGRDINPDASKKAVIDS